MISADRNVKYETVVKVMDNLQRSRRPARRPVGADYGQLGKTMHDSADRLDFAPPPQPAAVRAFLLAILAHVLLVARPHLGHAAGSARRKNVAAEAELWSGVPQQPAPKVEPKRRPGASAAAAAASPAAVAQGRDPARRRR